MQDWRAAGEQVVSNEQGGADDLANFVVKDTVEYLRAHGQVPTSISKVVGPILQVRPVDPCTADIVVMGSFRAHFDPSRPLNLEAGVAAAPAAAMTANGGALTGARGSAAAGTEVTLAGTTGRRSATSGTLVAPAAEAGLGPGSIVQKGLRSASANGYIASPQTDSLRQLLDSMPLGPLEASGSDEKLRNGLLRQERPGPIIEECLSGDMDAVGPRMQGAQGMPAYGADAGGACPMAAVLTAGPKLLANGTAAGASVAAAAAALPEAATAAAEGLRQQPIVELAGSLPSPAAEPVSPRAPAGDTEMEDAQAAPAHHLEGPALPVAAAYATAAATAAATGTPHLPYQPHQPHLQHHQNHHSRHQEHSAAPDSGGMAGLQVVPFGTPGLSASGAAASRALVVSANALQMAPRPRSEWELDPAKIVLGRRLAVGGFGEVFVAKYEGTLVAVKRLLATDSDTTQRFVDEVRMLARLRHPNLLLFMGYTLTPEPSIVTEFMARGSLFHILRQAGNRPPELRLQRAVALSVARGMAYLHSRAPPILHLDLKSPNVLVDDRWRIKIADFGLSRVRQRTYVSSGAAAGSPEWMAPEVLRCDHYAEAADVYSYGVVLWELLTGRAPWADLNAMQVVGAVGFARKSLPDPQHGDQLLLHLCRACRAHDPQQRPSFAQILQEMDQHYGPPSWPLNGGAATAAAANGPDGAGAAGAANGQAGAQMIEQNAAAAPATEADGGKTMNANGYSHDAAGALAQDQQGQVHGAHPLAEGAASGRQSADGTARLPALPAPPPPRPSLLPRNASAFGNPQVQQPPSNVSADGAAPQPPSSSRITRRYSLASVADGDAAAAAAAAAGGLAGAASSGAIPIVTAAAASGGLRADGARFTSMHESPRSRRRYRSPRGEDMLLGPPAITARMQDGRKTPSPRNANIRAWRGFASDPSDAATPAAVAAPPPSTLGPGHGLGSAPAPSDMPAGALGRGGAGGITTAPVARVLPAKSSPFACVAEEAFAPPSLPEGAVAAAAAGAAAAAAADGGGGGGDAMDTSEAHEEGPGEQQQGQTLQSREQAPGEADAVKKLVHTSQQEQKQQQEAQQHDQGASAEPQHRPTAPQEQEHQHQHQVDAPGLGVHPDQRQIAPTQDEASTHETTGTCNSNSTPHDSNNMRAEAQPHQGDAQEPPSLGHAGDLSAPSNDTGAAGTQAAPGHQHPLPSMPPPPPQQPSQPPSLHAHYSSYPGATAARLTTAGSGSGLVVHPSAFAVPGGAPPAVLSLSRHVLNRLNGVRPGHRRAASDEAHVQRLHVPVPGQQQGAAAGVAVAGGQQQGAPSGSQQPEQYPRSAAPMAILAQRQQQQQQQRLLAVALAREQHAGGGSNGGSPPKAMLPGAMRRSRGLSRNSAPMRYSYGSTGGQPQRLQYSVVQQAAAAAAAAAGAAGQGGEPFPLLEHAGSASAPSSPHTAGRTVPVVQLRGPRPFADPAIPAMGYNAGGADAAAAAQGAGADPWPDSASELSFAFILHNDTNSICSDDYIQSATFDWLPLLEGEEEADLQGFAEDMEGIAEDGEGAEGGEGSLSRSRSRSRSRSLSRSLSRSEGPQSDDDFELKPHPQMDEGEFGMLPSTRSRGSLHQEDHDHQPEIIIAPPVHHAFDPPPAPPPHTLLHPHYQVDLSPSSSGRASPCAGNSGRLSPAGSGMRPTSSSGQRHHDLLQYQHQQRLHEGGAGGVSLEPAAATAREGMKSTTYRSGRFKVTIEPAPDAPGANAGPGQCATPSPRAHSMPAAALDPVGPPPHLSHAPTAPAPVGTCSAAAAPAAMTGIASGVPLAAAAQPEAMHAEGSDSPARARPLAFAAAADAAAAEAPLSVFGATAAAVAAGVAGFPCITVTTATTAGTNAVDSCAAAGQTLSPTGSVGHPNTSCDGPASAGRTAHKGQHHHHLDNPSAALASAGPPVAFNSVTMYRKGRFFVQHAVAPHFVPTINPHATSTTSCAAAGSGSGGGHGATVGNGGLPTLSDDGAEAASGPASPTTWCGSLPPPPPRPPSGGGARDGVMELGPSLVGSAAAADGGAAQLRVSSPGNLFASCRGGRTVPGFPIRANSTGQAMACRLSSGSCDGVDHAAARSLERHYSCGRFTVAESIVAAPPDPRRPCMSVPGFLPAPGPQSYASAVVHGSPGRPGVLAPPLPPLAAAPAAAASLPPPAPVLPTVPESRVPSAGPTSILAAQLAAARAQPGCATYATAAAAAAGSRRSTSSPGSTDAAARAAGSSAGGSPRVGCEGLGDMVAPAPVVVRRVGRFTVRETDHSGAGSRAPSSSGTPHEGLLADMLGTSHCLEPASLAAEVARQLPQETPGGTAFGVPFHQPHHARSMPPPGSPTEDAMLCSRHSSSSFASASGCSRSSSGTPGLATECGMVDAAGAGAAVAACGDGGQLVGTGVLPAWVALHHKAATQPGESAPAGACKAAVAATAASALKVHSKGRFRVIEHPPGHDPMATKPLPLSNLAPQLPRGGSVASPGPEAQGGFSTQPELQGQGLPAAAPSGTCIAAPPARQSAAGAQGAGCALLEPGQRPSGPEMGGCGVGSSGGCGEEQQGAAAQGQEGAGVQAPVHGGVLHPVRQQVEQRAAAGSEGGTHRQLWPGGAADPQASPRRGPAAGSSLAAEAERRSSDHPSQQQKQQREFRADMERMVRECMGRNAAAAQEQQQQQPPGRGAGEAQGQGRGGPGGQMEEEDGEERGGGRCTYEVTFGDGLTIQISHGVGRRRRRRGPGEEEEEEDGDEVMLDVGFGDDGEGGEEGSSSEGEEDGEEEEDGRGGGGEGGEGQEGEGEEEEGLDAPGTPVHVPAAAGRRRRRRGSGAWEERVPSPLRRFYVHSESGEDGDDEEGSSDTSSGDGGGDADDRMVY